MTDALGVHELFNLAQMLQGENLPANILQLRECIAEKQHEGPDIFRFYILFLLLAFYATVSSMLRSTAIYTVLCANIYIYILSYIVIRSVPEGMFERRRWESWPRLGFMSGIAAGKGSRFMNGKCFDVYDSALSTSAT